MDLRALRPDEVERFVDDLWRPLAEEMAELDPHNALDEDVREDALSYRRDQVDDEDVAITVAEDGEWAGYVCVAVEDSPPVFARGPAARVGELYVVPDRRGEGVARGLLSWAETWGRERDCERVALSVNVDNDPARSLYEAEGFAGRRLEMDRSL